MRIEMSGWNMGWVPMSPSRVPFIRELLQRKHGRLWAFLCFQTFSATSPPVSKHASMSYHPSVAGRMFSNSIVREIWSVDGWGPERYTLFEFHTTFMPCFLESDHTMETVLVLICRWRGCGSTPSCLCLPVMSSHEGLSACPTNCLL